MLDVLTRQLTHGESLSPGQVQTAVDQLTQPDAAPETKADFLTALAQKGETAGEIAAFVRSLRDLSVPTPLPPSVRDRVILDVCGTGGDRLNTFNISTTVALVAAAAGVTVAKHGNRAITSQSGSADVLEALGIKIDLTPAQAASALEEHGFAFFFAPRFHPAFQHIAPARKLCATRGQRTIFNFLGPLLNPARPTAQLIGVPRPDLCQPVAEVLRTLGLPRALVVCGHAGADTASPENKSSALYFDEVSPLGTTQVAELNGDSTVRLHEITTAHFPMQATSLEQLQGGDRTVNAEITRALLSGEDTGPRRDAVLINTAAALYVAGFAPSLREGWDRAMEAIESGRAQRKLTELIEHSKSLEGAAP